LKKQGNTPKRSRDLNENGTSQHQIHYTRGCCQNLSQAFGVDPQWIMSLLLKELAEKPKVKVKPLITILVDFSD